MDDDKLGKNILIGVIIVLFLFFLESCEMSTSEEKIQVQIKSINGEIIDIDKNEWHIGDPFTWDSKYDEIYKITYKVNGQVKEGWVRFRSFGTDWKLN
jgi:hypothetical protein